MKKVTLSLALASAVALSPIAAMASSNTVLGQQMNDVATMLAGAVGFESIAKNWGDNVHDIGSLWASHKTGLFNGLAIGKDSTVTLANGSGIITLTVGTSNSVNPAIRGMIVTLTPKFITDANGLSEYSTRGTSGGSYDTAEESQIQVAGYTCAIDNSGTGANISAFQQNGETVNYIANTTSSIDQGNSAINNVFASVCSSVTVKTSAD